MFRIGLISLIFCKYATVIPMKSKQLPDVLAGLMEGIKEMNGTPQMIYSDEEGSLFSSVITEYLDEERLNFLGLRPLAGDASLRLSHVMSCFWYEKRILCYDMAG